MSDADIAAALIPPAPPAPPTTPAEAATRLDQLQADAGWRDKFLSGNGAHVAEFHSLTELVAKGDHIDAALAGLRLGDGMFQSSDHLTNIGVAESLRDIGIRDEIIRDVLAGTHQVTKAEYRATEIWKADRMADSEWTKKYLAGDREAKRQMTLADIIISGGIREESAA
ncbi:hypothetical protein [Bradyrhizobium sp. AZCC 2289]|uniref:hypothetical protein n=1 Tax=Bradyrhizobium sp. AZCC 2289 TaxID=3117026 RepID=UPI002FF27EB1